MSPGRLFYCTGRFIGRGGGSTEHLFSSEGMTFLSLNSLEVGPLNCIYVQKVILQLVFF